jgi:hypothetical protein
MAITYFCGTALTVSPLDGVALLKRELGLLQSPEHDHWVYNHGVFVMFLDYQTRPVTETEIEVSGFTPKLSMMMRPALTTTEEEVEIGQRTMMKIVNCLLRQSSEDVYFSYEWEHMILVRKNGRLSVSSKFDHYLGDAYLSELTLPFATEKLLP